MAEQKSFDSYLTDDNLVFIENEYLRLGANLSLGGALTHLSEKGKKNLINSADWGRQVQMSFYAAPAPFQPEGVEMSNSWTFIGWNPIQSGDCYRNRSRVLEYRADNNEIYVKCIPMHWPLNNYPGECTFEVWYRLDGYCVNVCSRINNARPDTTQYPARHQEQPAVYTNGEWYKGVAYVGKEPFTGGELTELITKENGLGWPWLNICATENWSALVDDNNYGLGVYIGSTNLSKLGFAFTREQMGWGGPRDGQTGYIAPLGCEILDHNITYSYDYSLIVGQLDFIRQTACEKDKLADRRHYSFEHDRNHFYYKDITDKGYPTGGCLDFDFGKGSELKSPPVFFGKGECKNILLDADFDGEITGEAICHLYEGLDEKNCLKLSNHSIPFAIKGNGERAVCSIDISAAPDAFLGFSIRFANEGHLKVYAIEIK
ncbi:MAG: hypothetical protein IJY39_09470 [Clostridia bacterium]|nr:hypothetical protein [Clostridia bacterium]